MLPASAYNCRDIHLHYRNPFIGQGFWIATGSGWLMPRLPREDAMSKADKDAAPGLRGCGA
jgi:hypothetical protein